MQLLFLRSTAIADDNRATRDITCHVTPHFGIRTICYSSAREACLFCISLKDINCFCDFLDAAHYLCYCEIFCIVYRYGMRQKSSNFVFATVMDNG